jgi:hypothetical protein
VDTAESASSCVIDAKMADKSAFPAFTGVGGGAVADWVDPEAPVLPAMPTVVEQAASSHLEVGSARLLAWRLSVATCIINSLCVFLAIGACASPWFGYSLAGSCVVWLGLSAYGQLPATPCGAEFSIPNYPAAFPENQFSNDATREVRSTLGFSQFLMVWAFFSTLFSAVSAGLLANAILRFKAPHRFGTAFFMNAFTATSFVIGALSTVIAVGRFVAWWNLNPSYGAKIVGPGQGSADAHVVFTCATMICTTIAKLKLRWAAQDSQLAKDKEDYAALLGADPDAEKYPQIPHLLRMVLC